MSISQKSTWRSAFSLLGPTCRLIRDTFTRTTNCSIGSSIVVPILCKPILYRSIQVVKYTFVVNGWANNGTLGSGDTIIVDGAKRDWAVWPGDMGIAVPSAFVSLGDLDSVKNALKPCMIIK
jgi:hypothetical protein